MEPVRHLKGQSIAKQDNQGIIPNEDHFRLENPIAVSDGAGGAGLFTAEWAEYLCNHLPAMPIETFEALTGWINSIWEPFCNKYQTVAEERGIGAKFLSDGSWATLVSIWFPKGNQSYKWLAYGDSAIFVFDLEEKSLDFCSVKDINLYTESPYLINWKEDPSPVGFSNGEFILKKNQIVLLASDAMSQYILLKYLIGENSESAKSQLSMLEASGSRLSVQLAKMKIASDACDFFSITLPELIESLNSVECFQRLTDKLKQKGFLAFDDYTLLFFN